MKSLRDGASGGVLKFFLLGFMALAVGGLVFTDMGGFFRGGVSGSDVAKVGKETITLTEFDRSLSPFLRQANVTRYQAYQAGIVSQYVDQAINEAAIEQAIADVGVRTPDKRAAKQIKAEIDAGTIMGGTPESVLERILQSRGMNEAQLVDSYKKRAAIEAFIGAFQGHNSISNALSGDIAMFDNETRTINYVIFKDSEIKVDENDIGDDDLSALYERTKEQYAIPENRNIQILTIKYTPPKDLGDDEALEELYALADIADDMAAGGANLENIAEQTGGSIKAIDGLTTTSDNVDQNILQIAFATLDDEISPIVETDTNTLTAVAVTDVTPKSYKPINDVKDTLTKQAKIQNKAMQNKLQALEKIGQIKKGDKNLSALGKIKKRSNLKRTDEIGLPFDPSSTTRIFEANINTPIAVPVEDGMAIVEVVKRKNNKVSDESLKATQDNLKRAKEQEVLAQYIKHMRDNTKIRINSHLLQQAYGTQREDY